MPSIRTFVVLLSCALSAPAYSALTIVGDGNIRVSVDPGGAYSVTVPDASWTFAGNIGVPLSNLQTRSGADKLGSYSEIAFTFHADVDRQASIRAYSDHPDILFTLANSVAAPNTFAFPNLTEYPRQLDHVTFSGIFAPPSFWDYASDSPWVFFDPSGRTFILSPAANFMTASTHWGANKELASGISSDIATLPGGFEHRTLLVTEAGINRAFDTWGHALTAFGGKTRPANDADVSLAKVGYWTDNGASYYYHTAESLNYEQTLTGIKRDFEQAGIQLGYVQLDSWFYPKGKAAMWDNNGAGIYQYVAAAPPFMGGLARFQQSLGLPLITHARWIDSASPYHTLYKMSGNVVIDPAYWDTVANYLGNAGVATFEQDWLADKAHTDFNLTDGAEFLDNMAAAMSRRNLSMQYCMASARHYLQSSKYSNLTTIRTSGDRLRRERWTDFLYASRLASALGAWPFADNFMSGETSQLLLATLSAGPVGLGDPIGVLHAENLLHAVRRDGVIVKPDVPLTPTDASYADMAHSTGAPQVAYTFSDFGDLRTNYVFAFAQGTNTEMKLKPWDLGVRTPVYVFDYFAGTGEVISPLDTIQKQISGDALYLVLTPVGTSGIAVVGDASQFVTMGKKRIPSITDNGTATVTVNFAGGEDMRVITGYSASAPAIDALQGTLDSVSYDAATHLFRAAALPGLGRVAVLRIQPAHEKVTPTRTGGKKAR